MFIKGLLAGLLVCAPVGPIGLLCIRRTLIDGRMAGLLSMLGASTADGLYCLVAGLGVSFVAELLRREQTLFTILGSMVLTGLGLRLFFSKPAEAPVNGGAKGLKSAYLSSLLLMLANPMPILVFTAVLASPGIYDWREEFGSILIVFAGICTGSALWGPILVLLVGVFGREVGQRQVLFLNRISGSMIFLFGLGAGLSALFC